MSFNADEFDVGGQEEACASSYALAQLREAIHELVNLEETIEQMEEDLKEAKKQREALRTGRIPELMAEIQSDHFTHAGYEVRLQDFVSGSLPKDPERRQQAIQWLEANDADGLIKTDVQVQFGRSQHNEALSMAEELRQEGYEPRVESGVHAQTLQAFAHERIKNGEPIDTEILGLYTGKVAKTKKVK